jgi:hypothetical protein
MAGKQQRSGGLGRPGGEVQQPPRPLVDQLDDPPEDGRIPTRIDQLLARVSRRAGRVPRHPAQAATGRGGAEPGLVEQAVAVPRVPHDTALDLAELVSDLPRVQAGTKPHRRRR